MLFHTNEKFTKNEKSTKRQNGKTEKNEKRKRQETGRGEKRRGGSQQPFLSKERWAAPHHGGVGRQHHPKKEGKGEGSSTAEGKAAESSTTQSSTAKMGEAVNQHHPKGGGRSTTVLSFYLLYSNLVLMRVSSI